MEFIQNTLKNQIQNWLTKLDLKINAIESIYQLKDKLVSLINKFTFQRQHFLRQLNYLKFNKLFFYKFSQIKHVYVTKNNYSKILLNNTLIIKNKIVQILFIQIIEPVVNIYANQYNFKKRKNAHQVIENLAKILRAKNKKLKKKFIQW